MVIGQRLSGEEHWRRTKEHGGTRDSSTSFLDKLKLDSEGDCSFKPEISRGAEISQDFFFWGSIFLKSSKVGLLGEISCEVRFLSGQIPARDKDRPTSDLDPGGQRGGSGALVTKMLSTLELGSSRTSSC